MLEKGRVLLNQVVQDDRGGLSAAVSNALDESIPAEGLAVFVRNGAASGGVERQRFTGPQLIESRLVGMIRNLSEGRIVRSGDKELALELEERGYGWIAEEAAGG